MKLLSKFEMVAPLREHEEGVCGVCGAATRYYCCTYTSDGFEVVKICQPICPGCWAGLLGGDVCVY